MQGHNPRNFAHAVVQADHALSTSQANMRELEERESKKRQLVRVGKANLLYNFAVAYVFIVTLVSNPNSCRVVA